MIFAFSECLSLWQFYGLKTQNLGGRQYSDIVSIGLTCENLQSLR
jgi:hypothetical protein